MSGYKSCACRDCMEIADDEDRAFRTVIANRMAAGQTPEEAILSFRHNDALYEVDGEVSDAPFEGPLPEVGEDGV